MSNNSKTYAFPGSNQSQHDESTPLIFASGTNTSENIPNRRESSYFRRRTSFHRIPSPEISFEDDDEKNLNKLTTFDGVFVPTALNVLSILMFLRFGFILGQMGIIGTFFLLIMSYTIDLLTTLSISAIATNGTVRGGGAYYMISRSLGPEFGGSIGLIFYIGQILNSGLNVVGFIEPLLVNLGEENGTLLRILPQGYWWEFLYSTILLLLCIGIALVGSQLVSKAGFLLFILLLISTLSVPLSTLFVKPFEFPDLDAFYTGPSWQTFKENLLPQFTKGAAGSQLKGVETFNDLFGIFFPATAGIFAGASMSGDLRKPSQSIPKGTLWGLLLTFGCYSAVILSLGASVPRDLLHKEVQIIQSVNLSGTLVLVGEFSTSLFSVIVGVVGAANVLQAIAKDSIFPKLGLFSKVDPKSNNPTNSIILTWLLTQLCLFANVNQIATFITMAFLMTFTVTNLACFLLKIAAAPNFRPSFKYFDWHTALAGLIGSVIAMFIVDGISATMVVIFLGALFLFIHYVCPPKSWGDVSQSLIYHQVRKYLLRLRQDNVKYWRPQILLLVDGPRSSWNLIQFCNNLKKGGLYILGHVIVTESFQNNFTEFKTQQNAWIKLRDMSKVKAFVQIGLGPTLPWGVRNVIMGSGLGGMKPNIVVLGYFDLIKHYPQLRKQQSVSTQRRERHFKINLDKLPTDECRNEQRVSIQNWISIIEDLILMRCNVAVAKGFEDLNIPNADIAKLPYEERKFIDLYPIQMSAEVFDKNGEKSALTTNFDTYTLILQLGAILATVPNWKNTHRLRIVVFVEDRADITKEQDRVKSLIEVLRIKATILVVHLEEFKAYNTIIKGTKDALSQVDSVLGQDDWWIELKNARNNSLDSNTNINIPSVNISSPYVLNSLPSKKFHISKLQKMGLSISMTTNKLYPDDIQKAVESQSDDESDSESVYSDSDLIRLREHPDYGGVRRANTTIDQKSTKNSPIASANNSSLHLPPFKTAHKSPSITTLSKAKKNQRPVFSSEKIPRSRVIDDATGDEPSIVAVPDDQDSLSSKRSKNRERGYFYKKDSVYGKNEDDGSKSKHALGETLTETADEDEDDDGVQLDINDLSFDDLPAKGQHLILNDVMKTLSHGVPVIFTTLPVPYVGTHRNEEDCKEYLENLQIWLDGLPPIMLINSQSMTVTTAL